MLFIAAVLHLWTWVSPVIDQIAPEYLVTRDILSAGCSMRLDGSFCSILFMALFGPVCDYLVAIL